MSSPHRARRRASAGLLGVALALAAPTARAETALYVPPECPSAAGPPADSELLRCFAPVFVVPEAERAYNRIGTPELYRGRLGRTKLRVDPAAPVLYAEVRHDRLGGRPILQLVYRVHFERVPLRLSAFFFDAHRNPGLLTLVTLDARRLEALFVTTVHTCGCYRAVIPTERLPASALPEGWPADTLRVYGERLPALLDAPEAGARHPVVFLQPGYHRVEDVQIGAALPAGREVPIPLRPIAELRSLPIEGADPGERGSIFYTRGPLRGHVRGAWSPLETFNVFSVVSLDPTVGMDKDFGDPDETGTPFYTMLRFWKHDESRLDRFDPLLRELGFRPGP